MAGPHTEVVRVGSEELEAQVAKALKSTAQEAGTTESLGCFSLNREAQAIPWDELSWRVVNSPLLQNPSREGHAVRRLHWIRYRPSEWEAGCRFPGAGWFFSLQEACPSKCF